MILTKENPVSDVFEFEGSRNILITGEMGTVVLERSIKGSDFYPLSTNLNGGIAQFECNGGCAYNGTLEEKGSEARYRFKADIVSGEIEIIMSRANR